MSMTLPPEDQPPWFSHPSAQRTVERGPFWEPTNDSHVIAVHCILVWAIVQTFVIGFSFMAGGSPGLTALGSLVLLYAYWMNELSNDPSRGARNALRDARRARKMRPRRSRNR